MSDWPHGGGEIVARIHDFEWAATSLGSIERWSDRLKLMVEQILASPLVATLVCGPERILIYNDAAAKLYGVHHPAALGRPLPESFPEGWATVAPFYERAFAGETVQVVGQPLDTRGEGVTTDVFDVLLTPVRETNGRVAFVHMTGFEVGDRVRTEAARRESEARNRLLIESWAQAVWETDAAGVVVADSPSWRAYTGQTLDEWLGYGWLDAIHPDDRSYAEQQWRAGIAAIRLVNAEFRLRAPDGGWRWTNVLAAPVLDAEGQIEKWVGLNIDIDARKRAEASLRESEARYRTLFETMGQGFCELQLIRDGSGRAIDHRYIELNPAFERLSGISSLKARGRTANEIFPGLEPSWHETYDRIVRKGVPERIEHHLASLDRWYEIFCYPRGGDQLTLLYEDITARKRSEAVLRENEERQAFLLRLSDTLRPLVEAEEIQLVAARLAAEHWGMAGANYVRIEIRRGVPFAIVRHSYVAEGREAINGDYPLADFPGFTGRMLSGEAMIVPEVASDPNLTELDKANWKAMDLATLLSVALVKGGSLVACFAVHGPRPKSWTIADAQLLAEIAERTWAAVERAGAEALLRESEERFQQFARASAAGLWIRDADTLAMEFVSPAIGTIYGVEPDALLGNVKRWAAMIVPEDREVALGHVEAARAGDVAVHEFRIQRPSDGAFRWIRNTDFPLRDDGHIRRIGGIAEDVTETRRLTEHRGVLIAELQHRVRNIMGMIRSMGNRTAPGASDIEAYRSLLEGRLLALARVQALLTREANAGGSLRSVIESEVAVQAHHGGQYVLTGPDIQLSPKAVEVLTLAFHELATNALKYGALSVPEGRLAVSWTVTEKRGTPWLTLDWIEEGAPPREPSTRRGFGSELIEGRIPYELGGRGKITIAPEGARCHLEFPLKDAESILETDAPQPATVFGGMLDMTGAPDLTGRTILVVEDDYFLASDTAAALRGAGAEVLGPCPSEDATRDLLDNRTPTHAVLDLNLGGGGPRFEIAHLLKARGVPFVFLTGYDPDVIPKDLANVVRLQKPLPFRAIVEAMGQL